jgi:acyl carrier protein
MKNVVERVKKVIKEVIGTEEVIREDMMLKELGYDSLKNVELVVMLEEEFNIRFDDSQLSQNNFETVSGIIHFVKESLGE